MPIPSSHHGSRRLIGPSLLVITAATLWIGSAAVITAAEPGAAQTALHELRGFRELGSVLYVAAHPDDENTQLIAYLARGRSYRTAYLSLTRGDGGQNVIGPELFEELGVIRTQELLAARRADGGRQFFTRAIDFGYSKSAEETLRIWNRNGVVSDIVRVIRTFRPDVVITRFSPRGGGHGHHTASAILAVEAFKLAGDPKAFPDQVGDLAPWQPNRILQNSGGFGRGPGGGGADGAGTIRIEIGGDDPVTGESLGTIAARSRSMHRSQGFANFAGGGRGGGGPRSDAFTLLAGEPATKDILDGVDTTWARVSGGAEVGKLADVAITKFNKDAPAANIPALLAIRKQLGSITAEHPDPLVLEKRRQLDRAIQACLGLVVATTVPHAEAVPGETLAMRHVATLAAPVPVRWVSVVYPLTGQTATSPIELHPDVPAVREEKQTLPAAAPLTQPYWLRAEHTIGMATVTDRSLIGRAENPPAFPVVHQFQVGDQTFEVVDEVVQTADGGPPRRLDVIAPVAMRFLTDVRLFAPGTERPADIEIAAERDDVSGNLDLDAPDGWRITPAKQPFRLVHAGDRARLSFAVRAPSQPASAGITARAQVGDSTWTAQRVVIQHDHIPMQLLQPPARLKAVALDLAIKGRRAGYIPGAGDRVAECLTEMGYEVTRLGGDDLTADKLRGLSAVVIGVRAFNVRRDLAAHTSALFDFADQGGTVVVQYNRPNGLVTSRLAPYELRLSDARVTDENAPVTFLAPDHPALTVPNKITDADMKGWVQERGIYFPARWDSHFTPILAAGDPDEKPLQGGLLVAKHGRGYFVYTGLVFFRQLPAGVPGAYRLFANLVSLGQ